MFSGLPARVISISHNLQLRRLCAIKKVQQQHRSKFVPFLWHYYTIAFEVVVVALDVVAALVVVVVVGV